MRNSPIQQGLHSSCRLFPNLGVRKEEKEKKGGGEWLLLGEKKDQQGKGERERERNRGNECVASELSFVVLWK